MKTDLRDRDMRCSVDLRQRVEDVVRSGGSKAEAARRFKVGEASVDRWLEPGGAAYKRPGPVNFCIHPAGRPINTSSIKGVASTG